MIVMKSLMIRSIPMIRQLPHWFVGLMTVSILLFGGTSCAATPSAPNQDTSTSTPTVFSPALIAPTSTIVSPAPRAPTPTVSSPVPRAPTPGVEGQVVFPHWFAQVVEETRHFRGEQNAPVTIIEFSDFQCPYCGRFVVETFPHIERYIQEGIVRYGYRHAPFQGEGSLRAAEASECAADQGAFWAYHDRLFRRLVIDEQRSTSQESLKQLAAELNLDPTAFAACLDEGRYASLVKNATHSAQDLRISGTPTFFINGHRLVGAQPFAVFEQAILAAKSGPPLPQTPENFQEADRATPEAMSTDEIMAMLLEQTRQVKGSPDAPVTMIIFSDFQCIYCARFALEVGRRIDDVYVASGKVRVGYIHAAYHGDEAMRAAEASECAGDQGAFWEYHDRLFERLVSGRGEEHFPMEVLKQIAADLQLNTEAFNTCLAARTHQGLVQSQTTFSQAIGVPGTPMFVLNGKGVSGMRPFEEFQALIDAELGAKP